VRSWLAEISKETRKKWRSHHLKFIANSSVCAFLRVRRRISSALREGQPRRAAAGAQSLGASLSVWEVAELPNRGWSTKSSDFREERTRMEPSTTITPETHWERRSVNYSNLVNLGPLMERSSGATQIVIGLMDGPVAINHPDLAAESIREIAGEQGAGCSDPGSAACTHGTFTAGILGAKRSSPAPAICPGCTLMVTPHLQRGCRRERGVAQCDSRGTRPGDH
jgi:hypothetical protein